METKTYHIKWDCPVSAWMTYPQHIEGNLSPYPSPHQVHRMVSAIYDHPNVLITIQTIYLTAPLDGMNLRVRNDVQYDSTILYTREYWTNYQMVTTVTITGDAKDHAQFERRLRKQQCYKQPYAGRVSCAAEPTLIDKADIHPIAYSQPQPVSLMVDHHMYNDPNPWHKYVDMQMKDGAVHVPQAYTNKPNYHAHAWLQAMHMIGSDDVQQQRTIQAVLYLNAKGEIYHCDTLPNNGTKYNVPIHTVRSSGIEPYYTWDNLQYILPGHSDKHHQAWVAAQKAMLEQIDPPWKSALAKYLEQPTITCQIDLPAKSQAVISYDEEYLHDHPEVQAYAAANSKGLPMLKQASIYSANEAVFLPRNNIPQCTSANNTGPALIAAVQNHKPINRVVSGIEKIIRDGYTIRQGDGMIVLWHSQIDMHMLGAVIASAKMPKEVAEVETIKQYMRGKKVYNPNGEEEVVHAISLLPTAGARGKWSVQYAHTQKTENLRRNLDTILSLGAYKYTVRGIIYSVVPQKDDAQMYYAKTIQNIMTENKIISDQLAAHVLRDAISKWMWGHDKITRNQENLLRQYRGEIDQEDPWYKLGWEMATYDRFATRVWGKNKNEEKHYGQTNIRNILGNPAAGVTSALAQVVQLRASANKPEMLDAIVVRINEVTAALAGQIADTMQSIAYIAGYNDRWWNKKPTTTESNE